MKKLYQTEVAVIGAGAVGCSIAYWLAKRGKEVVLIDKGEIGAGTSSANFGLIWVSGKEPNSYMELNLKSSLLWPKLVEELDEDVDLRQDRGGLALCLTKETFLAKQALVDEQRLSPLYQGRMLSPKEVIELQPGVTRKIVGAVWSPHDGDCNPIKWNHALARGCIRLGVRIMKGTCVVGVDLDSCNRVTGVITDKGFIGVDYVINAAGPWAAQLAEMVNVTIGIYPERGQILILESAPLICPTPMSTVRQCPQGHFYLGFTAAEVGFNLSTNSDAAKKVALNGATMVPFTQNLSVIRQFAGLRSMPKDELPFIGPVPHVPGYFIATGHSGITLSPIYGKIMSDLIVDGKTDIPLSDYDPLRYDSTKAR